MTKTVIGAGAYTLDTIVVREYPEGPEKRKFIEKTVLEEVGGTCGNVMTMLPYLGIQTFPVAILDRSEQGFQIKRDLERYGADTRFVRNEDGGGTTLMRCTHKTLPDGSHKMNIRATSPGSMFPKRKQLGARSGEAAAFAESLDFTPDLFFFDDPSAGNMVLAEKLRRKGSTVYFEPEKMDARKMRTFLKRVDVSDIVKFSGEKITDDSFTDSYRDKLFIQTLGKDGLRFRLKGGKWNKVAPVANDNVVDWEGAGDWTSSAFIAEYLKRGYRSVKSLTEDAVREILFEAQKVASRSISFMGSKGMISNDTK